MVAKNIIIRNQRGLHLKPAGYLCREALNFESKILIRISYKEVNAKSVLGVLSACIKYQDEIELVCEGNDEQAALEKLSSLIESGLGEDVTSEC